MGVGSSIDGEKRERRGPARCRRRPIERVPLAAREGTGPTWQREEAGEGALVGLGQRDGLAGGEPVR